ERVGSWAPNCAEWAITQFATAKIGAVLVNINPSYRTHELEFALRQSGTSTLILQGAFKTSNYVEMLSELAPEIVSATHGELDSERLPELSRVICLDAVRTLAGMLSWQQLLTHAESIVPHQLAEQQAR